VLRTRVGYTGGTQENPTYHRLGDHIETVEMDYDPGVVSYEELLKVFWQSHNPRSRPWSRQYLSAIFYHNEAQKQLALETRDREALTRGGKIHTEIVPAAKFYRAEDYHQKYYLRMKPELVRILRSIYPSEEDFDNSTIAARLNGYVAGQVGLAAIEAELGELGLPAIQTQTLLDQLHGLPR
jgi:peptide-methionine (S)-S-oxide reductase